jgi:glycosyltransferase involved in cell wall biosynthesis
MSEPGAGLVSVLMPTFNGQRYLLDALRSAVAQTYEHLEIVICDDGSSDATLEIARSFAAADPRVRIHLNEVRLGVVGNFERCLALASGPYVKYLMQDDLLEPHAVERLLEALLEADDVVLATSRRTRIDERGEPLPDGPEVRSPYARDTFVDGRVLGDTVLEANLNLIGEPSCVLFRRSALGETPPFSLGGAPYRYLADLALWTTLLSRGRAAYLVDPLSRFRHHDDQDSRLRSNMVVSVLEWQRLHREARALGFLATDPSWERAVRRWLQHAPFFFRFCSGVSEAATLLQAIVGANADLLRLAQDRGRWQQARAGLRSTVSCLHASLWFPVGGLGAERIHHVRSSLRRSRARRADHL